MATSSPSAVSFSVEELEVLKVSLKEVDAMEDASSQTKLPEEMESVDAVTSAPPTDNDPTGEVHQGSPQLSEENDPMNVIPKKTIEELMMDLDVVRVDVEGETAIKNGSLNMLLNLMWKQQQHIGKLNSKIWELEKPVPVVHVDIIAKTELVKDDGNVKEEDKKKPLDLQIKRLPMSSWHSDKKVDVPEFTSNVLVVFSRKTNTNAKSQNKDGPVVDGPDRETTTEMPQRLVINSRPLIDEIGRIIEASMIGPPLVMLAPFKALVCKKKEIEDRLKEKQNEYDSKFCQRASRDESKDVAENQNDTKNVESERAKEVSDGDEWDEKAHKMLVDHLEVLVKFINQDLKDILELRASIEDRTLKKIAFDDLWHLFKPGDLVFKREKKGSKDLPSAFRVHNVTGGRPIIWIPGKKRMEPKKEERKEGGEQKDGETSSSDRMDLYVDHYYTDFDGWNYGVLEVRTLLQPYSGTKNIVDLDIYPAEFDPDYKSILAALETRGRNFKKLADGAHRSYKGATLDPVKQYIEGEVMVDFRTGFRNYEVREKLDIEDADFNNLIPSCIGDEDAFEENSDIGYTHNYLDASFDLKRHEDHIDEISESIQSIYPEEEEVPEDWLILLPRRLLAYAFKDRGWHFIDIHLVKEIDSSQASRSSGFDQLVLDPAHKDLILALVENHASVGRSKSGSPGDSGDGELDIIRGKGKGTIILLHGAPGVGKTLTAETVAAHTGRPLYPITCGDLGETPTAVESRLNYHAELAHKWGCVLLLDEADVFLAKRSRDHTDMVRNGLVSVFLRILEYYSGILFLTTNRIGSFDEAFKSRIHISIWYPPLDKDSTRKLWENQIKRLDTQNKNKTRRVPIEINEDAILKWARKHYRMNFTNNDDSTTWNGRQIRNAFQTAISLAEYDRAKAITNEKLSETEAMEKYPTAKLSHDHLKKVAQAYGDFEAYLKELRGGNSDASIAGKVGQRLDFRKDSHGVQNTREKETPKQYFSSAGSSHAPKSGGLGTPSRNGPGKQSQQANNYNGSSSSDDSYAERY